MVFDVDRAPHLGLVRIGRVKVRPTVGVRQGRVPDSQRDHTNPAGQHHPDGSDDNRKKSNQSTSQTRKRNNKASKT